MRIYDPKVGRFLSMDPITSDYPWYTPYQFAGNKPIIAADLDGLEEWMKTQEILLRQRVQLQVDNAYRPKAQLSTYNPSDRSWAQRWRDSKNVLAKIGYEAANGLYTLPQQFSAKLTGQEYIFNIGGNLHESSGIFGEKQRMTNFVNGVTTLVPSAGAEAKVEGILAKYTDDILMKIENQVTQQSTKQGAYKIASEGGRHAGFLKTYLNKSVSELENGIGSFGKEIEKHQNLLRDPETYLKQYEKGEWNLLDPRQQKALIEKKWPGDIQRLTEQKEILEGVLKSKK